MPDHVSQKQLTEVFFLFPEFIDADHKASAPYIHNMDFRYAECTPSFITEFNQVLAFFKYEKGLDMYYDKKNLEGMLYPYKVLEYPCVDSEVRTTLRDNDVLDWREELGENGDIAYWRGNKLLNDTCSVVYIRSRTNSEEELIHSTLYVLEDAIENDNNSFVFNKNGVVHSLAYQDSRRDLHIWLSKNRIPQRRFRYCKKHGQKGKGGWILPDGSHTALLDCDCHHAQEILIKAIGDISIGNDLWYYDGDYHKVLYFEYQNDSPQKEYHGYHLSPGDKGYERVNFDLLKQIQDDIP